MPFKTLKILFLSVVMLAVSACGKSKDQEVKDAILDANILLSTRQCQEAIDLLEGLGRQNRDAKYLKALSASYACRAGYSTTVFFADDIAKTASPSPMGGMTTYSTSTIAATSPLINDSTFKDMQTAIDLLLYAGGISSSTEPTSAERLKYFSPGQASDINAQMVFMMLVQTGRLMKVYANASAAGVKGGGSASNTCFTDYSTTPATVQTYVTTVLSGACHTVNSSHVQLDTTIPAATRKARLCQGVVLMNAILDVLPGIIATAGGGDLDDIASVTTKINTQKTALVAAYPTIGTTATVMSQYNCENDTTITNDTLASYYALVYEGIIQ